MMGDHKLDHKLPGALCPDAEQSAIDWPFVDHRLKQWAELLFADGRIEKTLPKAHKNP